MRLIKFPSIEQYRNVTRNVQHKAQFVGLDEAGDPIINRRAIMPKLLFEGTVKLHGTNAGVVISPTREFWTQSRENIITPEKDNAGFAMFAQANMALFLDLAAEIGETDKDIVIYGEWCGGNIQERVAICQLPKMFVIFGIAFADVEDQITYLTREEIEKAAARHKTGQVRVIYDFPTWRKEIDFENPAFHQNELNKITEDVEQECPVGKTLGSLGVGEGVVWRCVTPGYEDSGFWFKVKGKNHSASKVRTLAAVDVERLGSIKALAEQAANNERLEQMHQKVFDTLNGGETEITKMGYFIKAVMVDIFKEDIDLISASGFTSKELSNPVSKICRNFILDKLEIS
jgi:hypothetical protein